MNEQDLRDTVNVELTALRIGNSTNFMDVQRSASEEFIAFAMITVSPV